MSRPKLQSGDVLRYDFEFGDGQEKLRPAVVIAAVLPSADGKGQHVLVMPITHSPRRGQDVVVEVPAPVQRHVGLDESEPSYVVLNELNVFDTPGFDWQRVPETGEWLYKGRMPPAVMHRIQQGMAILRQRGGRFAVQSRDEPKRDTSNERRLLDQMVAQRGMKATASPATGDKGRASGEAEDNKS